VEARRDLLPEAVERLAVRHGELLPELDVLIVPSGPLLGEARSEGAHVFLVKGIANAKIQSRPGADGVACVEHMRADRQRC
jgi:hypothetical protein